MGAAENGPVPRLQDIDLLAYRHRPFGDFWELKSESFGGVGRIDKIVEHTIKRLAEGNAYLLAGSPSLHVLVRGRERRPGDDPQKDYPVFWWREDEA
jgi:hypothetical protein